ncbi:aldo/keto reductase [Ruegeria atlantica]|uniref:aldo/keto reductase n=1 Tax=Ruegeria atlantica TaxID=81569 RepID=UPI001480EFF7|nr:aldo/keto reductase [Ruegeria atlantica]
MSLLLPDIGLGTAAIAGLYKPVPLAAAIETLEEAWQQGIRYFDTAPHYGQGKAERLLGDALRTKPAEDYVISTKVGRLLRPSTTRHAELNGFVDPLPFDQSYDYSYDGIMRSFEDSYQRLGLSRIDILYLHDIGMRTHGGANETYMAQLRDGGFRALERLKASGAIKAFGLGVNEVEICEDILEEIELDLILLAGRYTLLDRSAERSLLKTCLDKRTQLVIGGVFNSGILATGAHEEAHWDYGQAPQHIVDKVRSLSDLCRETNTPLPSAALAFPKTHPAVACTLLGNSQAARIKSNLQALRNTTLTTDFKTRADAIVR